MLPWRPPRYVGCFGCMRHDLTADAAQCGWLLTIANLGDSRAVLDTGAQILQLSVDHRVATHRAERHRLERTGALIAPIDVSGEPLEADPKAGLRTLSMRHLPSLLPVSFCSRLVLSKGVHPSTPVPMM